MHPNIQRRSRVKYTLKTRVNWLHRGRKLGQKMQLQLIFNRCKILCNSSKSWIRQSTTVDNNRICVIRNRWTQTTSVQAMWVIRLYKMITQSVDQVLQKDLSNKPKSQTNQNSKCNQTPQYPYSLKIPIKLKGLLPKTWKILILPKYKRLILSFQMNQKRLQEGCKIRSNNLRQLKIYLIIVYLMISHNLLSTRELWIRQSNRGSHYKRQTRILDKFRDNFFRVKHIARCKWSDLNQYSKFSCAHRALSQWLTIQVNIH